MTKPQRQPYPVQEPAANHGDFVQDRAFRDDDGRIVPGNRGWRRREPLVAAFEKGQLAGGKYHAATRYEAAVSYGRVFSTAQSSGRDSTQALNVTGGAKGAGLPQAQADAIRALAVIHSHLGQRDRMIVLMVCGEGYKPVQAVRETCGEDYRDTVPARFREALDALIEAMDEARRAPNVVRMAHG